MEPLPRGANFQRCKLLWEIGLQIAGDPATPYYVNRDMMIAVGSSSGGNYRPWVRMATSSAHLAHAVCGSDLEMSMVILSGISTHDYSGTCPIPSPLFAC